jgi:hypothetical protein
VTDPTDPGGSPTPWVVAGIIGAVGIATVIAYAVAGGVTPQRDAPEPPETGTACAPLSEAHAALEAGDTDRFEDAIAEARAIALRALDTSGVKFGAPERIGLQLGANDIEPSISETQRDRIVLKLESALSKCEGPS